MASDLVISCKATPGVAAAVDRFAAELHMSRSAAVLLLLQYGLTSDRGAVIRGAIGRGFDQRKGGLR